MLAGRVGSRSWILRIVAGAGETGQRARSHVLAFNGDTGGASENFCHDTGGRGYALLFQNFQISHILKTIPETVL